MRVLVETVVDVADCACSSTDSGPGGAAVAVVGGLLALGVVGATLYAVTMVIIAAVMMLVAVVAIAGIVAVSAAAIAVIAAGVRAVWDQIERAPLEAPLQARVEMFTRTDGTIGYRPLPPGEPAPGTRPSQVQMIELPAPRRAALPVHHVTDKALRP